jgi:hypothetical protein
VLEAGEVDELAAQCAQDAVPQPEHARKTARARLVDDARQAGIDDRGRPA